MRPLCSYKLCGYRCGVVNTCTYKNNPQILFCRIYTPCRQRLHQMTKIISSIFFNRHKSKVGLTNKSQRKTQARLTWDIELLDVWHYDERACEVALVTSLRHLHSLRPQNHLNTVTKATGKQLVTTNDSTHGSSLTLDRPAGDAAAGQLSLRLLNSHFLEVNEVWLVDVQHESGTVVAGGIPTYWWLKTKQPFR